MKSKIKRFPGFVVSRWIWRIVGIFGCIGAVHIGIQISTGFFRSSTPYMISIMWCYLSTFFACVLGCYWTYKIEERFHNENI